MPKDKKALETVCKCIILNYIHVDDRPDACFMNANEHAILYYAGLRSSSILM